MSENENKTADKSNPADDYINEQLVVAKATLGRTKMVSVILVIIVLAYMSFVTKKVLGELEPATAADTARQVILIQVAENGQLLADQFKQKIPEIMQGLPDMMLARIPKIREGIEERVKQQLDNYAYMTVQKLDPEFDKFLEDHKDDIKTFLEDSQDIELVRAAMGEDLDDFLANFLQTKTEDGDTLQEKFDKATVLLNNVADQTQRLAHDDNLTEQEKRTRRAIAVLLQKAEFKIYDANSIELNSADDPTEDL